MLGLAFVAVGSVYQHYLLAQFLFSPFRLFLPLRRCPFFMLRLLRKSYTPGLPFFFLPSFRRARWGWAVSGCPCVASRGSSSPPARLWSSGRGGGASGRSFGARKLASVSSVHSWTGDPGVALSRRTPATCSVPVGSPSSFLHARRGDGAGESLGAFSVLGCLSRLICTLGEVVRRVSLPSAAPVRVLPGLPIFGLGSWEGALSPLLVGWLL